MLHEANGLSRRHGAVRDAHAMVQLIARLEAPQDADAVGHLGLLHQHLLESPLQRGVLWPFGSL